MDPASFGGGSPDPCPPPAGQPTGAPGERPSPALQRELSGLLAGLDNGSVPVSCGTTQAGPWCVLGQGDHG